MDARREEPLLLRVTEAARLLSVSRSTLYELLVAGELRSIKVGRVMLIPRSEVDAWVARKLQEVS